MKAVVERRAARGGAYQLEARVEMEGIFLELVRLSNYLGTNARANSTRTSNHKILSNLESLSLPQNEHDCGTSGGNRYFGK